MRCLPIIFAVALLLALCGCSGVSTLERENLTSLDSRQEYIKLHPQGGHIESIRNGEIVPGMGVREVIASWGLPNVYVVKRTQPTEQWIYYIKDRDSLSMLIYTLTFADDTLQVWDISQKRFVAQGILSKSETVLEIPASAAADLKKK